MDDRKLMILQAIIDDYITTAVPVGSRTVSRKSGVGYSPATIRNEMSDLEELGYLAQPHTSAGRIPSYKAYRLYADRLVDEAKLPAEERERMNEELEERLGQTEALVRKCAGLLADATGYTAVIVAPQLNTMRIRHLQIVPVTDTTGLMVIVTGAGIVKEAMIRVPEGMTADMLYEISRMLTDRLADRPIEAVRQLFADLIRDMGGHRRLLAEIMSVIEDKLSTTDNSDIIVGGGTNMLSFPEYRDPVKARQFLSVLESGDRLRKAMKTGSGSGVTVRIGPENEIPELRECTVLAADYDAGDRTRGTLGIIGPVRMDYNRAISVLKYMGMALSDMLSDRR